MMPKLEVRRLRRMVWSVVSNATLRSRERRGVASIIYIEYQQEIGNTFSESADKNYTLIVFQFLFQFCYFYFHPISISI